MPEMPASVRRPFELRLALELQLAAQWGKRLNLNAIPIGRLRMKAAWCMFDSLRRDFVGDRKMQGERPCELLK